MYVDFYFWLLIFKNIFTEHAKKLDYNTDDGIKIC